MANNTLLKDLHDEFVGKQKFVRGLRSTTIDSYKETFRVFLKLTDENLKANELNAGVVLSFFEKLETRTRVLGNMEKTGIKVSTRLTYYCKLNAFFKWLKRAGHIATNPLEDLDKPKAVYEDIKYLRAEDVLKIITAINLNANWKNDLIKKRNLLIIYLLLLTGIRKGELLGLRVMDYDEANNLLKINGETSKSKVDREIPLNIELQRVFRDYLRERKDNNEPYLLVSEKGDRFTEDGLKHLVEKIKKLSGVRFHLHQFRHTFAMNMVNKGIDIIYLQRLMGHQDIRQTSVYLRKIPTAMIRNKVELLDLNTLI